MASKAISAIAVTAAMFIQASAEPLDLARVAKESKWMLHLDLDSLRKSRIGEHLLNQIVQPKLEEAKEAQKLPLSLSVSNISSVTAFGAAFENNGNGVLLVRTSADVKKDLDTLAGISSLSGGQAFTMTHLNPYPLYSFQNNVFLAPNIDNTVVVAKSKDQIEHARRILLGEADSLAKTPTFAGYPSAPDNSFFLVMAEGFSQAAPIPPQAQVLRETRGGRLAVGEKNDAVFANLVFKGKDDEAAMKIQQVFQGIVALITLSQDNKELNELARAARIAAENQNVSIHLQFPIQKTIEQLDRRIR